MQILQRLVQKYDAATVFVFGATIVVILELSLMRILVPAPANADELSGDLLMSQVCTDENILDSMEEIEEWNSGTKILSERLSNEPLQWQKQLISFHAFDMVEENEVEVVSYDSQREQFMSAADYAAENLSLQSVMSGRTMLANINGSIYRVGDTISLRGGEIVMRIIEIGSAHAVVQLADNDQDGDTKRTIHIASTLRLVKKEQLR
jgi:hypothetical protein